MIVITGAAGFIGSYLAGHLNRSGREDLILADDFSVERKRDNFVRKQAIERVERDALPDWLDRESGHVELVVHLGARTDTTETDRGIFDRLNLGYTKRIWQICSARGLPLIYASSAATYGAGELGYDDDHEVVARLTPLNPYGDSKNDFDRWALDQVSRNEAPPYWAGLKFFNVYGPNEYHKGRMASVVFHAFNQIRDTGAVKLFCSHREGIADGEQKRDFIHVDDVCRVIAFLARERPAPGLYNLGTGRARSFLDLARGVFAALEREPNIRFIPTPEDIRETYQYFTEARMSKLSGCGYHEPFRTLEAGIGDYVRNYLTPGTYY